MPFTLSLKDGTWSKFDITMADGWVMILTPQVQAMSQAVLAMHAEVPIESVVVLAQSMPADYTVKLVGGREGHITFSDRTRNPTISFDTTWKLSEIDLHRRVWLAVIPLLMIDMSKLDMRPA